MTVAVDDPTGRGGPERPTPEPWPDPATACGEQADAGLVAAFRAKNHAAWRQCLWTLHACRARAGSTERVTDRPRAGKIAAASLGWSETCGATALEFAHQILERLPALGEAMREGWLEEKKAAIFTSIVADLDDAQARIVVDRLLGRAPELTYGQLRTRVEKTAEAVDPAWAEARLAAALARARVIARTAPSGAAELCGLDLPFEQADQAHDRIVALADAVRDVLRAHGRDVALGVIRSQVMLRLLGPEGAGLDDHDVVDLIATDLLGPDDSPPDPDGGPGPDDPPPPPDGGPGGDACAADPVSDSEPGDEGPGRSDGGGPPEPELVERGGPDCATDSHAPPDPTPTEPREPIAFRARVAVRLDLRTALGLDHRPGEVPDQGPICSSTAHDLAWRRLDGPWHLHLYDPDGHLEHVLLVRPPRDGPPDLRGRHRRQHVELTAHTALLDALSAQPPALTPSAAQLLERARRALAAARARPPDQHPAHARADAHRRRPGHELDRWVRARDHTCRSPGCPRPATGADLDHTLAWEHGGQSTADDLGALCERDHLQKHDPDSGWTVVQPAAGTFVWTAPTGTRHVVTEEPYDELPDPAAPAHGPYSPPTDDAPPPPPATPFAPRRTRDGRLTPAACESFARRERRQRDADDAPPSRYDGDPDF